MPTKQIIKGDAVEVEEQDFLILVYIISNIGS